MKWCVVTAEQNAARFEALSQFMTSKGITNTLTKMPATSENVLDVVKDCQNQYDFIRIGPPFGNRITHMGVHNTEQISRIRSGDALIKIRSVWWPKSFLFGAIMKQFSLNMKSVNHHSAIFIVGAGSTTRVLIGVFAQMGFLKFHITDRDNKLGSELMAEVKKTYFNVEFQFVPQSSIMLLPGVNSVMINTTPLTTENTILKDLYYFNFLKNPATVIDMNLYPIPSPLSKEAAELGAHCIHGYQFAAQADADWLKEISGVDIQVAEYQEILKEELNKIPFDTTPFNRPKD
ncbi:MAG: hypothetical protein AB7F59_13505 [Bdellovibrionales bacterium]